ncbi:hypothetical protein M5D96_008911 [Drosophila gunungcola]|uniref:Uncharacterized protein n=1 Tax=Drosophila gunungcola TaxID=103775 RepID=A0A9Q0BMS3_9MUSC|nr:hypothetical protein M5D96_008911 [Drosophila gunungcola]
MKTKILNLYAVAHSTMLEHSPRRVHVNVRVLKWSGAVINSVIRGESEWERLYKGHVRCASIIDAQF